ncbi:MAG TPA: TatD family hydrolase [Lactobacillaceae bacterium]|jgi:TatD DNase family protein
MNGYDTHTHLNDDALFADAARYVAQAADLGIHTMNVVGYNALGNARAIELAEKFDGIFSAVGFQPEDVNAFDASAQATVFEQLQHEKVVAVGETGLDYYWDTTTPAAQKVAFAQHLAWARELDLPVIVHNREAFDDVYDMLKDAGVRGVLHSFSGTVAQAQAFLDLGFYLSFSGVVTFKKADEIREAAKIVPLDRLLVETDAPYLTPVPYRGKQNEPGYTAYTLVSLAETLDMPVDELAAQTTANAKALFGHE